MLPKANSHPPTNAHTKPSCSRPKPARLADYLTRMVLSAYRMITGSNSEETHMVNQVCASHRQAEFEGGSSHQPRVSLSQYDVCANNEHTCCG